MSVVKCLVNLGHSQAVLLPKAFLDQLRLNKKAEVDITLEDNAIIIRANDRRLKAAFRDLDKMLEAAGMEWRTDRAIARVQQEQAARRRRAAKQAKADAKQVQANDALTAKIKRTARKAKVGRFDL